MSDHRSAPGPAPCRAACPVGTDAAAYVALAAEGRWFEAYDVARRPNPLASICGRICAAPCEQACRRGVVDSPIAIRALKRVLTERHGVEAVAARWAKAAAPIPPITKPSVGIVGAGPAGLAAAHDLRLAGHAVTLYEAYDQVGGMLTHGVPSFRLPKELIHAELQAILDLGTELHAGVRVGRDVSIETLLGDHEAVLISVGCQQGRMLETPGVELAGVVRAVDFLRNLSGSSPGRATDIQGPVVVVGGGSVAFDAARSAWRLQSDSQTMLDAARSARRFEPLNSEQPRDRPAVTIIAPEGRDEMSMQAEEFEQAEQEGIAIENGVGPRRILGSERVEALEVSKVLSLLDEDGRFAPRLAEERSTLSARTLVLAVGQTSDTAFLAEASRVRLGPGGSVQVDRFGRTGHPRLYGAGDVTTGPRDLIQAIASGQTAAATIAQDLAGGGDPPARAFEPAPVPSAPPYREKKRYWSGFDAQPRVELPIQPLQARAASAEVEASLSAEAARREAERCLRCDEHLFLSSDRCIACGLCVDVCPYACLKMEVADSRAAAIRFRFNDDACIRCRLCVDRCPADALGFERIAT